MWMVCTFLTAHNEATYKWVTFHRVDQGLKALARIEFTRMRLKDPFPIKQVSMSQLEPNMRSLIELCCTYEANNRPTFAKCSELLQDIRKEFLKVPTHHIFRYTHGAKHSNSSTLGSSWRTCRTATRPWVRW